MTKTAYVALYPSDFLADIGHLGNTELGIYTRLLLVYYRDQRPLPVDQDRLRRLAMTFSPEECRALESVVSEFFVLTAEPDGTRVWRHRRADKEIVAAQAAWQKRVDQTAAARRVRHKASEVSVTEPVTESVTEPVTESVTGSVTAGESEPEPEPEKRHHTHTRERAEVTPTALAVAMRRAGVEANGAHPAVIALAEQGVAVETVVAACREACQRKPGERVPVTYVARVLESWAKKAAELRVHGAQAPPTGRPASKGAAFLAALDRTVNDSGVVDVQAAAGPARLGR
jgi:uncharacterized protein YdaU (DUF1376 family)